jgi:hypothetical protein
LSFVPCFQVHMCTYNRFDRADSAAVFVAAHISNIVHRRLPTTTPADGILLKRSYSCSALVVLKLQNCMLGDQRHHLLLRNTCLYRP